MGLFGFGKKKTPAPKKKSEFEQDIEALLARDDIQCRSEICEAEYRKALELLKNPTEEKTHRAYDLMGPLAAEFDYLPAILWMGNFAESALCDLKQAAFWYKKAADLGDGNGARNYADMLMTGNGIPRNPETAIHYYVIAANSGVPEAAFVLGELFRNSGDTENAVKAYRLAKENGYAPAGQRLQQMGKN